MIDPDSVDDDAVQKTLNMEQRTRAMLKAIKDRSNLNRKIILRKICRMVAYPTADSYPMTVDGALLRGEELALEIRWVCLDNGKLRRALFSQSSANLTQFT